MKDAANAKARAFGTGLVLKLVAGGRIDLDRTTENL
jgi:hypothetical protein